jgi:hypothetical protein
MYFRDRQAALVWIFRVQPRVDLCFVERLEGEIRWMKGRRIWKLREAWLRTKRALRRRP